jgi:hypothetical protein
MQPLPSSLKLSQVLEDYRALDILVYKGAIHTRCTSGHPLYKDRTTRGEQL